MFLRNAGLKTLSLLLGGGALFAFNCFLMRAFGPAEYGTWAYALGWAGMFAILIDFGFNPLIAIGVSQSEESGRGYFNAVLRSKLLLTAIAAAAMAASAAAFRPAGLNSWLVVAGFAFLMGSSFAETVQAFITARERFREGVWFSVWHKMSIVVSGVAAIIIAHRILETAVTVGVASVIAASVSLLWFNRHYVAGRAQRPEKLWVRALPLFLQNLLIFIYFRIDTVMLGAMRGSVETGIYNAAYRFFEVSNVLPTALVAASTAALSRKTASGDWWPFWQRLAFVFGACAIAGAAFLAIISTFMPALLGEGFAAARPVLLLLSLTVLFFYPNYLLTLTLVMLGKASVNAWVALIATAFNVGANLFAIPRWGAMGAGLTTALTEALITAASVAVILRSRPAAESTSESD